MIGHNRELKQMDAFQFMSKLDLTLLLGRKARNVTELLTGLREVPAMCVYFHTHRTLQQHQAISPEPPNDFAYWVTTVLNNDDLGERLASIDALQFNGIEDIRQLLVSILEEHKRSAERESVCPRGKEFHFMTSQTFVFPTRYTARTLSEFRDALEKVTVNALSYHLFYVRMRPELESRSFSTWIRNSGHPGLANAIQDLDPYSHTLEGFRKAMIRLMENHGNN
jgi:hypothetical protein